ncbi:putative global regulator [Novipirellula aureliae]|uniref:Putative global regulator n=1 Tax=Novipirellula aureliae TaxID=2527966 RepID=A0A5C6DNY1_9BACT|nr:aminomethyltransferase [Novipirellula aureliae]TWU36676.1 putative global regulator [Novipirellula aureliae]
MTNQTALNQTALNQTAFVLENLSVIDLVGTDSSAVLNNLTTNAITKLAVGQGCETFVTDVRGKTVGHFLVFKTESGFRLIGAGGQSERFAAHVDRYTIREDVSTEIRDADLIGLLIPAATQGKIRSETSMDFECRTAVDGGTLQSKTITIDDTVLDGFVVPWIDGILWLVSIEHQANVLAWISERGIAVKDDVAFHEVRTLANYPWYGIEVTETNLPQEINREEQTISFVKGCYLGQETVARLDAMGQVQKKLVRWSISSSESLGDSLAELLTTLNAEGKTVGRLTSVAKNGDGEIIAIGFARRSHFDPGAVAAGTIGDSTFEATVIENE